MKPNISVLNAIMRITCGLAGLAWATSRMARRPHQMSFLMVAVMCAMKVGEGIHRYCPVTDFIKQKENSGKKEDSSSNHHEK